MTRLVLLDSERVGLASRATHKAGVAECLKWIDDLRDAGTVVVVPDLGSRLVNSRRLRVGPCLGHRPEAGLPAHVVDPAHDHDANPTGPTVHGPVADLPRRAAGRTVGG